MKNTLRCRKRQWHERARLRSRHAKGISSVHDCADKLYCSNISRSFALIRIALRDWNRSQHWVRSANFPGDETVYFRKWQPAHHNQASREHRITPYQSSPIYLSPNIDRSQQHQSNINMLNLVLYAFSVRTPTIMP